MPPSAVWRQRCKQCFPRECAKYQGAQKSRWHGRGRLHLGDGARWAWKDGEVFSRLIKRRKGILDLGENGCSGNRNYFRVSCFPKWLTLALCSFTGFPGWAVGGDSVYGSGEGWLETTSPSNWRVCFQGWFTRRAFNHSLLGILMWAPSPGVRWLTTHLMLGVWEDNLGWGPQAGQRSRGRGVLSHIS